MNGQVSEGDTSHTATIEDNETGMVDFQADQANAESVDPTARAILTITGVGSGTVGLDTPLSVTATNAFTGTTNAADLSAPFGAQVLAFAVGDGATINSTSATLDV